MELYPIPPEIKIERKLPYLVLAIENHNFWHLFGYLIFGFSWLVVIYARSIAFLDSFNIHDGLWLILTLCLSGWYLFSFWNDKIGVKCGVTELRLDNDILTIDRKLWKLSKRVRVSKLEIDSFYQLKDDFRKYHWGLKLKTIKGKRIELFSCKPIAVSNWLGILLADTYGVDFIPSVLTVR